MHVYKILNTIINTTRLCVCRLFVCLFCEATKERPVHYKYYKDYIFIMDGDKGKVQIY